MPFGLDLKSVIITVVFLMFVLPYIRSALLSRTAVSSTNKAAQ